MLFVNFSALAVFSLLSFAAFAKAVEPSFSWSTEIRPGCNGVLQISYQDEDGNDLLGPFKACMNFFNPAKQSCNFIGFILDRPNPVSVSLSGSCINQWNPSGTLVTIAANNDPMIPSGAFELRRSLVRRENVMESFAAVGDATFTGAIDAARGIQIGHNDFKDYERQSGPQFAAGY